MLRITTHADANSRKFQLEGQLAGLWVDELKSCSEIAPSPAGGGKLLFDLTGVTYIDGAGKDFLKRMHRQGAQFMAVGCLMRAIVEEVSHD